MLLFLSHIHDTLQAFLEEVEQWKPCIEAVNESGERLISDFSTDDTGRIRQILQRVGERWAQICERYVSWLFNVLFCGERERTGLLRPSLVIPRGPLVFQAGYHPHKRTFKAHPKHAFSRYENRPYIHVFACFVLNFSVMSFPKFVNMT